MLLKHSPFSKVILFLVVYPEDTSLKIWNAYVKVIHCTVYSFEILKTKCSYKTKQLIELWKYHYTEKMTNNL